MLCDKCQPIIAQPGETKTTQGITERAERKTPITVRD